MSEREPDEMKKLLKAAVEPVGETEPRRDLWPAMLARMARPDVNVPWWDWVLLAGASLALCFFPGMVPMLLYHL